MAANFDENIEVSLVASVLKDGSSFPRVQDLIQSELFWWRPFGWIWESFERLYESDKMIDKVTLLNDLNRSGTLGKIAVFSSGGKRGKDAIEYIENFECNPENIEGYAKAFIEACAIRRITDAAEDTLKRAREGIISSKILSNWELETGKIVSFVGGIENTMVTAKEAIKESIEVTTKAANGESIFIETGLTFIDDVIGGLGIERVIMIAGGTGDGKTALLSSIINQTSVSKENNPVKVGWISLEMGRRECVNRIISNLTGISTVRLDKGRIKKTEKESWKNALDLISESPVLIEDNPELNIFQLKAKIRKMVEADCKYIGIDQLNLIDVPQSMASLPDYMKYNWIGYKLKAFAREFKIPILILHQISREINKGNNRGKNVNPIAQDVDSGGDKGVDSIGIIRHTKDGDSWLNWVKNRQGAKERRPMRFIGERMRFEDAEVVLPDFVIPDEDFENLLGDLEESGINADEFKE